MVRIVSGDLFKSKCQVIIITVNCVGVMGAGIAKICKMLFPKTFAQYKRKCDAGEYKPGQPRLVNIERPLLLFPTKDHWRKDSQYEWIKEGLKRIAKNADKFESMAIPPLGCGHGNLDWNKVRSMILEELSHLENTFELYDPTHTGPPIEYYQHNSDGIHSKIVQGDIRVAVTGGRDFNDKSTVFNALDKMNERHRIVELIHGGARGADSLSGDLGERAWYQDQRVSA